MKQCIDYALANLTECNLSFSFTTNLTLMTEEIADYLGQVSNLSIVLSMDEPAEIHNMVRVYSNNRDTFDDAYRGLKYIAASAKKYGNITLTLNSVLMPPYTEERFDKINDFFSNMDFLPEGTNVQASYPSKGTVPESYYLELQEKGYDVNAPINISYCNGCCIPGQRRLYVCTDGTYKVCERVGDSPSIGNIDNGVDTEAIKKYYLHEYEEKSIRNCSNCWALRLCDICYADCYDQNGINVQMKAGYCEEVRERYKSCKSFKQNTYEF